MRRSSRAAASAVCGADAISSPASGPLRTHDRAESLFDSFTGNVSRGLPSGVRARKRGGDARREEKIWKAFERLMSVADARRRLRVRANADTPEQSRNARDRGAEGIGLCRTEHMFLGEERVGAVRQMIFAETEAEEQGRTTPPAASARGFIGIFR
jgi:hypothetical protein